MWQRFSANARRVVFFAQEEAQVFGEGYVSTEHLLLGLCREQDCVGAKVLSALGVSLEEVRDETVKHLPKGDSRPSQDMTLTPRAKRVIDLAYQHARELNDGFIGSEHLLLALISESEGLAGRVLAKLGIDLSSATQQTIKVREENGNPVGGNPPLSTPPTPKRKIASGSSVTELLIVRPMNRADMFTLVVLAEDDARSLLDRVGVDWNELASVIETKVIAEWQDPIHTEGSLAEHSNQVNRIIQLALEESTLAQQNVGAKHMVVACFREGRNLTASQLANAGITLEELRAALQL